MASSFTNRKEVAVIGRESTPNIGKRTFPQKAHVTQEVLDMLASLTVDKPHQTNFAKTQQEIPSETGSQTEGLPSDEKHITSKIASKSSG
ncbi:putative DNA primase/helicase [Sesbania bispinosa]|nr:putative DNA primase/helicase [Sesbania bispinosa]